MKWLKTGMCITAVAMTGLLPRTRAQPARATDDVVVSLDSRGDQQLTIGGSRRKCPELRKLPIGTVIQVEGIAPGKWVDILGLKVGSETSVRLSARGPRLLESGVVYVTEGITDSNGQSGRMPVLVETSRSQDERLHRWCVDSGILGVEVFNGLQWRWRSPRQDLRIVLSREVGKSPFECTPADVTVTCAITVPAAEGGDKGIIFILAEDQCAPGFFPAFVLSGPHWTLLPTVASDDSIVLGILHGAQKKGAALRESDQGLLKKITGQDLGPDVEKWYEWWQTIDGAVPDY